MRILFFHNRYQQAGGEDNVVQAEMALLRARGHDVELCEENNDGIVTWIAAAQAAAECIYSRSSAKHARSRIQAFRPHVVHVHNFFPRLSPSIHYACHDEKIPVVQTLHNFRLLCPAATLLRDGRPCEDCLGSHVAWPALQHSCYQSSKLATAALVNMLAIHRSLKTWDRVVTRFIALTEFARDKFIQGGLPGDRIVVKPNFVNSDPGVGTGSGGYALFVGRLSQEKGLDVLLDAWKKAPAGARLKIVGDGPMAAAVKDAASTIPGIEWLGSRSKDEVSRLMADAAFLIVPSVWYESFGLVMIEAFAVGLPVIASRLGAMRELVSDGKNGKLFTAGSSHHLSSEIESAFSHPELLQPMRRGARREFERKYTAEINYELLRRIYQSVLVPKAEKEPLESYALQG
jgi:glycosyltransferase involved in cell wall biosynthesis